MNSSRVEKLVADNLESQGAVRNGNGYEYEDDGDVTRLSFIPKNIEYEGINLASVAEIETVYGAEKVPHYSNKNLGWLNSRAAFGSFRLVDNRLHLKAKISVYTEEPADHMISDLIVQAFASQQTYGFYEANSRLSDDRFKKCRGYLNKPREWSTAVTSEEYKKSAEFFTNNGYLSSEGSGGFTMEVAMSGEGFSRIANPSAQTALLKVATDVMHPLLGVGYMSTIALPINPGISDINDISITLNELESSLDDFVPCLGAWSVRLSGYDLVYSSFIPTDTKYGIFHQTLMNWNLRRTIWLRDNYWDADNGVVFSSLR